MKPMKPLQKMMILVLILVWFPASLGAEKVGENTIIIVYNDILKKILKKALASSNIPKVVVSSDLRSRNEFKLFPANI